MSSFSDPAYKAARHAAEHLLFVVQERDGIMGVTVKPHDESYVIILSISHAASDAGIPAIFNGYMVEIVRSDQAGLL